MKLQELRYGVELETVRRGRENVAKAIQSIARGEVTHVQAYATHGGVPLGRAQRPPTVVAQEGCSPWPPTCNQLADQ